MDTSLNKPSRQRCLPSPLTQPSRAASLPPPLSFPPERGFICAEVMKFEELKELGTESAVKAAGKYRQQGKVSTEGRGAERDAERGRPGSRQEERERELQTRMGRCPGDACDHGNNDQTWAALHTTAMAPSL